MNNPTPYWEAIKGQLRVTSVVQTSMIVLVSAIFPIVENVLTSKWFGSPAAPLAGWCLLLVGCLHLLFTLLVIINEGSRRPDYLAQAAEDAETLRKTRAELARRENAYKLVRQAFDQLNASACDVSFGTRDAKCNEGYRRGLEPILNALVDNGDVILGVSSRRFSLQVAFRNGFMSIGGGSSSERDLLYVDHVVGEDLSCSSMTLEEMHILAVYCFHMKQFTGDMSVIPNNVHPLELKDGKRLDRIACVPIYRPCTDYQVGELILASAQDTPFADDVLTTLQFFSSIIAKFTEKYVECVWAHVYGIKDVLELEITSDDPSEAGVFRLGPPHRGGQWSDGRWEVRFVDGGWEVTDVHSKQARFSKYNGVHPSGEYAGARWENCNARAIVRHEQLSVKATG